ncbi:unnamed protein product, partial [Didymodactylos carnosus]
QTKVTTIVYDHQRATIAYVIWARHLSSTIRKQMANDNEPYSHPGEGAMCWRSSCVDRSQENSAYMQRSYQDVNMAYS